MQKGAKTSNMRPTIVSVVALVSGAVLGTFLFDVVNQLISARIRERPDYEKGRYAQGLTPMPVAEGLRQYVNV
jgi:hypothetical protein